MMILLGKNVLIAVDLDEMFSQRHSKEEWSTPYEREINEGFLWSWPELWAFVLGTDDLEKSEWILNKWPPWVLRSPIPLFLTEVLLLNWDSTTSLERTPLANMADWKTITLWWGLSRRVKFLGWNLLHGEWIWSPTAWLQSWAFKCFYSGCFLGPGWGCPLYIVTPANWWSPGVRIFCMSVIFPQRTEVVKTQWAINEMT